MDYKELEILAERFWQGQTSEQEESKLREAVLYGEIPASLEELREYFQFAEEMKGQQVLGDLFDKQIMKEVERREEQSSPSSYYFLKIAAGLAVILGMFFLVNSLSDNGGGTIDSDQSLVITDTYDDPEIAYQEVKKALLLVGKNMNEGLSYTGNLGEFDKATDQIEKEENRDASRTDK